mmetsp:Transcript_115166/g.311242  ORF Transcript_115166/g.311242 Transcript_115166/m.311242 type:complete len:526 (-) Transcript_115166:48-1625(-)
MAVLLEAAGPRRHMSADDRTEAPPDLLLAERYAMFAVEGGELPSDMAVVLLQPWSLCGLVPMPEAILAPVVSGASGDYVLGQDDLLRIRSERFRILIVPCTFETSDECRNANNIFRQVSKYNDNSLLFLAFVLPEALHVGLREGKDIMRRYDVALSSDADGVLFDAPWTAEALRWALQDESACAVQKANRLQDIVEKDGFGDAHQKVHLRTQQLHKLLWADIPSALLRHFPRPDPELQESEHQVGPYTLLKRETFDDKSIIIKAKSESGSRSILKMTDKATVYEPSVVESLYREYTFLHHMLPHPHIVRCHEALHTRSAFYLVFPYAGRHTLLQLVDGLPGKRLQEQEALSSFRQVSSAVAYCHQSDVCHRNLGLNKVVVSMAEARLHCTLIGFSKAIRFRGHARSKCYTDFPYCAPETAHEEKNHAKHADVWSVGMMLLEAAGGLNTVLQAWEALGARERQELAPWTDDEQAKTASLRFIFLEPECHAKLLALKSGVNNRSITDILSELLVVDPEQRSSLTSVV